MRSFRSLNLWPVLALAAISSGQAFGADEMLPVAVCRDARHIADAGYEVVIRSGGIAGITEATVSEQSIMGPRDRGHFIVKRERKEQVTTFKTASNDDFRLDINLIQLHNEPVTAGYRATMVAELNGERVQADLRCNFVRSTSIIDMQPVGGPTCMAFWSGWVFNENTGRCEKQGRSGCSNPFRFRSAEQCEQASAQSLPFERQ